MAARSYPPRAAFRRGFAMMVAIWFAALAAPDIGRVATADSLETVSTLVSLDRNDPQVFVSAPEGYEQADYGFGFGPAGPGGDPSLGDGMGVNAVLRPGAGLRVWGPAVEIPEGPALLRCTFYTADAGAGIAAALLDTEPGAGLAGLNGSLGTNQLANASMIEPGVNTLDVLYNPQRGAVLPLFQVVSASNGRAAVFLDQMRVIPLRRLDAPGLASLFGAEGPVPAPTDIAPFPTPPLFTPTPFIPLPSTPTATPPPGSGVPEAGYSIASGLAHALIVKPDTGALWAWGANEAGQLGVRTNEDQYDPVPVDLGPNWRAVSAGGAHSMAIRNDGTLWTWGNNAEGQLGIGTLVGWNAPVRVGTDSDWTAVSAGVAHCLALKADGTLWAWGNNDVGQLGDQSLSGRNAPVRVGEGNEWKTVSAGGRHSAAIGRGGGLWVWGSNLEGQVGIGSGAANRPYPSQVDADRRWIAVSAGAVHTAAVAEDGGLWTWGRNAEGQLGDGSNAQRIAPVRAGSDTDWMAVSAGGAHTVALKRDGSLWAWGENRQGQAGLGGIVQSNVPVRVGEATDWAAVAAGGFQTIAVKRDGTVWGWGLIGARRDGSGTPTVPAPLPFDTNPKR